MQVREVRESRREVHVQEHRETRGVIEDSRGGRVDVRIEDRRHRTVLEPTPQTETVDNVKRHKRHKHDRMREREGREKIDRDVAHREKQMRETLVIDNFGEDPMEVDIPIEPKQPKEMTEQELRKER